MFSLELVVSPKRDFANNYFRINANYLISSSPKLEFKFYFYSIPFVYTGINTLLRSNMYVLEYIFS